MSGRLELSLDLNQIFAMFQQAPAAIEAAIAQGIEVPPALAKYAPLAGFAGQLASKVIKIGPDTGLEGLDTGPSGKGRLTYLRMKSTYSDYDVSQAFYRILDTEMSGVPRLKEVFQFTLNTQYQGVSLDGTHTPSVEQTRAVVDNILGGGAMPEPITDKFGDLINLSLLTMIKDRRDKKPQLKAVKAVDGEYIP